MCSSISVVNDLCVYKIQCSPVGAVPGVGEAEGPGVVALGPGRGTQQGGHEEAQQNHSETGDTVHSVRYYCIPT